MPAKPYTLREASPLDASWFAPRLRPADLAEVRAMVGPAFSVKDALDAAIEYSTICGVAEFGGVPAFIIGCAPDEDGRGQPWLMATPEADRYPVAMTKITKQYIKRFLDRYPALLNYVDARHAASIRWLERLGFAIHEPLALGAAGEPFRPFSMGV